MVQTNDLARRDAPNGKFQGKKREILAAASRVFRQKGLSATGMRDIAAELDMAVGNLYYYFKNKDDLLAFVQEETLVGLLALTETAQASLLRADARLFTTIVEHVVLLNETMPGSLAHLQVEALTERRRTEVGARRDAYRHALRRIVEEGIAAGVFLPADPSVATLAILGAANWTVRWFRPGGRKSAREIGREVAELLVRGLMAPGINPSFPAGSGEEL
jgi:AcrR family transcriptional regulator